MGFYVTTTDFGEELQETFTCCHCNRIVRLAVGESLKTTPIDMCTRCNKRTCSRFKCRDVCAPFEKKMERFEKRVREAESRDSFLRAVDSLSR